MALVDAVLTDEHREFRERADAFAREVVAPRAAETEASDEFPRDVVEAAGDRGLLGVLLPEEHGGAGSDFLSYCLVVERVAEASGAVAESIQGHTFAALPIARHGTDAQREAHLPGMVRGDRIGAMLLTEPGAGSSPTELETTAEELAAGAKETKARAEEAGYRLDGEKAFGTNAGVADVHLVVARKRPAPDDGHGVSVFLAPGVDEATTVEAGATVEGDSGGGDGSDDEEATGDASASGMTFERERFLGMRGHVTGDTTLDGVAVPADALLGDVGQGFRIAMGSIDMARTGLGAIGVGIARAAFDRAVSYAGEREQGGRAVGEYQAVQVLLAEMDAKLSSARHLVYDSAASIAAGDHDTRASSRAKFVASDAAEFVTRNAIQVHGGRGYSTDLPLERYFRDAKILSIIGGTTEIQKTTVAREALGL